MQAFQNHHQYFCEPAKETLVNTFIGMVYTKSCWGSSVLTMSRSYTQD